MKPSNHYYEAHLNLGKMNSDLEKKLPDVLKEIEFKTTDIVSMPYKDLESEDFYIILTTKDSHLGTLTQRVKNSVSLLQELEYDVQRYKIESTIYDSKYEDKLELLNK